MSEIRWRSPKERAEFLGIDYIDITNRHFGRDDVFHRDFDVWGPNGYRIVHRRIP